LVKQVQTELSSRNRITDGKTLGYLDVWRRTLYSLSKRLHGPIYEKKKVIAEGKEGVALRGEGAKNQFETEFPTTAWQGVILPNQCNTVKRLEKSERKGGRKVWRKS